MIDVDDEAALEPVDAGARRGRRTPSRSRRRRVVDLVRRPRCRDTPGNGSTERRRRSRLTTRTSLPSCRSANAIASGEPMASPSGRTCEVTHEALPRANLVGDRARRSRQSSSVRHRRGRSSRRLGPARGSRAASFLRAGRGGSARCGPGARSTRRTGTRARARGAGAAAPPIWRRKNGVARSSAFAVSFRAFGRRAMV